MKFIHTADWHIGNKLHDIDRSEEFKKFFAWLKEKIFEEKAESLIVAGDIFDTVNSSVEARTLFFEFLASLINSSCKNIVIVAGNHDSGAMLEISKDLLKFFNIHIVGNYSNSSMEDVVFELFAEDGSVEGICCAVPFVKELELKNLLDSEVEEGSIANESYGIIYKQVLDAAKSLRGERDIPIIATGHLYASNLEGRLSNCNPTEKTDDGMRVLDVIGNLGNVSVDIFSKDFDYVALGHIHYATRVSGKENVRYSGSPFVLGFDEAGLPRHILSVEIDDERKLEVKKIECPKFLVLKRIEGDVNFIKSELVKLMNCEEKIYIELMYEKDLGVNIQSELSDVISMLPDNILIVSWRLKEKLIKSKFNFNVDAREVKSLSEEYIFTNLILEKEQLEIDSEEAKKTLNEYLPLILEIAKEVSDLEEE